MNKKKTKGGKSDERTAIKGKKTEREDYLISVVRESTSDLATDK